MVNNDPSKGSSPASASQLVSTLIPTLLIALVYVGIFVVLRRSQRRFYAPRTYLGSLREQERSPALPTGLFNWIGPFFKIPDTYALQHQSIDAYLFLRYLRICSAIAFFGAILTWPILFPINATGGGGQAQLDTLSMSNINTDVESGRNRLYAHALVGWLFYGFVLFMICRESIFFINLRQAFLLSPIYANRISARTVLFTSVPEPYLNEGRLRKVFGKGVKNIWITGDTSKLDDLVKERDKAAYKLESAEVKLIKLAHKERMKAEKNGAAHDTEASAETGNIAARWVSPKKRPTHKTGFLGLIGSKVDSITWCREQLQRLIPETEAAQNEYYDGNNKKLPGVFIEFVTQSEAQAAYQTLSHHQALHMSPRYIGVQPGEIVWKSLRISWWQKVIRRYAVLGFITALIVFWAIPVAAVGFISNVNNLTGYTWLAWINKIPTAILGVITGLLPAVLLAVLMALVPIIMRLCAKLSGEPTLSRVELFTQNAYFAFQVVQVFLVVTLSSGAAAVIQGISSNPGSAPALLANGLPKASNFYIAYFILQGLTIASSVVSQVVGFVIFRVLYKFLTSTPRSMYKKWTQLSSISWGSVLPIYANITVIAITYAMIAPLVLGFATIGLYLFYLAYRYNVLFVTDSPIDTKGLIYPRALQHLFTGVYLSQICLIGLFGIARAPGPLVLTVIALIFTVLFQVSMNSALGPLLYNLPKTLEAEEEELLSNLEDGRNGATNGRGSGSAAPVGQIDSRENEKERDTEKGDSNGLIPAPDAPHKAPNLLTKFLAPHIYTDYATLRRLVPHDFFPEGHHPSSLYSSEQEERAYDPPSATARVPLLWIPRDNMGISRQECEETSKVEGLKCTDEGATLSEKGNVEWDVEGVRPPVWEQKTYY